MPGEVAVDRNVLVAALGEQAFDLARGAGHDFDGGDPPSGEVRGRIGHEPTCDGKAVAPTGKRHVGLKVAYVGG
ncbi:MAG TPA: hypothetical protein VFB62_16390, partial [Polyangiaceae bacterium]|nr:hypothetical protein [Polyangiaceae bacterium]